MLHSDHGVRQQTGTRRPHCRIVIPPRERLGKQPNNHPYSAGRNGGVEVIADNLLQPDGTVEVRRYEVGDTQYHEQSPADPLIHDLENVGETTLRFVTVELLD